MTKLTVEALKKHARKYGTDGILETGIDCGLNFEQLVELQKVLDQIEGSRRPKFAPEKRRRLSVETRVKRALGLDTEEEECQETTPRSPST